MAGGRPKIEVDWTKVDAMCQIQCTGEEIASVLGIDYDTLATRCKDDHGSSFSDYIGEKKQGGRASLRRKQWKLAESGNPTMLIWLGKQYLGQSDKQAIDHTTGGDKIRTFSSMYAHQSKGDDAEPES